MPLFPWKVGGSQVPRFGTKWHRGTWLLSEAMRGERSEPTAPDAAARRRSLLVRKQSGQQQWLQRPSHRCRTIDSATKGPVRHHQQEHGDAAAHVTQTTQRQGESAMSSVAIPIVLHGIARAPHLTGDCSTSENPPLQRSHERQRIGLMLPARRHCKLAPFHRQPRRRLGGQPMYVENGRGV